VLTYFEFEEVECVGESLSSCEQVDFYSQQKRSSDGLETRCFEVSLLVPCFTPKTACTLLLLPGQQPTGLSRLACASV
jgi:hypothetical protein